METLTKDEFFRLDEIDQMDYINDHAEYYTSRKWLYGDGWNVYDADSDQAVDNLFDYALDMHYEATDLQGKLFSD